MTQPGRASSRTMTRDQQDLGGFGYTPALRRALGPLGSFAVAFSMISVTTGIFFLFSGVFTTTGGWGIWLWLPVAAGLLLIVLVYMHLGARIPLTGYAYQWNSRLVGAHYGWFTGWTALLAFMTGTASIAVSVATVFAPEIWTSPSKGQVVLLATVVIVAAAVFNIISIRATALVNNLGVSFEIAGSVIATLIVILGAIFFFKHSEGIKVLGQSGPVGGGPVNLTAIALAALLPVYVLIGWEGAADLAEETIEPRLATPKAMLRASVLSIVVSLFMIIGFSVAIPHGVPAMINQAENPLFYIFRSQVGAGAVAVLKVIVFIAMFSCLLANMAVGTRMSFSLARDGMLPASRLLAWTSPKTYTPVFSVILVAAVALAVNLLSAGIATRVVSIASVCYYGTYALTLLAAYLAARRNRLPDTVPGGFSLGRWLTPIAVAGAAWAIVIIVALVAPAVNHITAEYAVGAELLGFLWWLLYLRPRLDRGELGVAQARAEPPASASVSAGALTAEGVSS